jgi:hypothetical protein
MSTDENNFYVAISLSEISVKVWFDQVKTFSSTTKQSEDVLNDLKILVKQDIPTLQEYLKKENKQRIMRAIVEGVVTWREVYEEYYQYSGRHNQTPEQRELKKNKEKIYGRIYYYWKLIGKACFDGFPETLRQPIAPSASSPPHVKSIYTQSNSSI